MEEEELFDDEEVVDSGFVDLGAGEDEDDVYDGFGEDGSYGEEDY